MGRAVVELQEGLEERAFDPGGLPIVELDLFHGVHTPVVAALCRQREQVALTLRLLRANTKASRAGSLYSWAGRLCPIWDIKKPVFSIQKIDVSSLPGQQLRARWERAKLPGGHKANATLRTAAGLLV